MMPSPRRPIFGRGLALGLLLTPLAPSGLAAAATLVNTDTTADVAPARCVITVAALPFSTYTGKMDATTATLTVTCTDTTPYNVALNAGLASGATVNTRWLTSGAARIAYSLCSDAAHKLNWGQTIDVDTVAGTGNGHAQVLTVYGQIDASQYPAPGTYTDTIVVTVIY